MLATEGVELSFAGGSAEGDGPPCDAGQRANEDIGARRLQTIIEKVIEEISFDADHTPVKPSTIDAAFVQGRVGEVAEDDDLSNLHPLVT